MKLPVILTGAGVRSGSGIGSQRDWGGLWEYTYVNISAGCEAGINKGKASEWIAGLT